MIVINTEITSREYDSVREASNRLVASFRENIAASTPNSLNKASQIREALIAITAAHRPTNAPDSRSAFAADMNVSRTCDRLHFPAPTSHE